VNDEAQRLRVAGYGLAVAGQKPQTPPVNTGEIQEAFAQDADIIDINF
jgi:hypothetical protein